MKTKKIFSLFSLTGLFLAPLSFCVPSMTFQSQQGSTVTTATLYDITVNEILPPQANAPAPSDAQTEKDSYGRNQTTYQYAFPMESVNMHLGDSMSLNAQAYCAIDPEDKEFVDKSRSTIDPNNPDQVLLSPTWSDGSGFGQYVTPSPDFFMLPTDGSAYPGNFPGNTFNNAPEMPVYGLQEATRLIPMRYDGFPDPAKYPKAYQGTIVISSHHTPGAWSPFSYTPTKVITLLIPMQISVLSSDDTTTPVPFDSSDSQTSSN